MSVSRKARALLHKLELLSNDPTHPSQIALRTYGLALSLSLGPSLVPFVIALITKKRSPRYNVKALRKVLRRELGFDGFAFSVTIAVGGGSALRRLWSILEAHEAESLSNSNGEAPSKWKAWLASLNAKLKPFQKSLIGNLISSLVCIVLLQAGRYRQEHLRNIPRPGDIPIPYTPPAPARSSSASPTLDLTLLLVVRALDVMVQTYISKYTQGTTSHTLSSQDHDTEPLLSAKDRRKARLALITRVDALFFWACSARIMWCFFYDPQRLPQSYVRWIRALAGVDGRLLRALRLLRRGEWSYTHGSPLHPTILTSYAKDLGYPSSWGDPLALPAFGGREADAAWKKLGVSGRSSVGGIPCEIVHGGVGSSMGLEGSCTANAGIRGMEAFLEALAIYLPAHFLPVLITRPQVLLRPHRVLATLLAALRSSTFLTAFISSYWFSVCFTRSLGLARLFPWISHNIWDGPYGCILAGCLMCGSSIWIENGHRRGEMALYVLPRAIRASIPERWIKSRNTGVMFIERLAFVVSLASLLTTAVHLPDSLRGLSRWTLAFIINGPRAGFWQRRRRALSNTNPATPTRAPRALPEDDINGR